MAKHTDTYMDAGLKRKQCWCRGKYAGKMAFNRKENVED